MKHGAASSSVIAAAVLASVVVSWNTLAEPPGAAEPPTRVTTTTFDQHVLRIAREYKHRLGYRRVSEMNFGPTDCLIPSRQGIQASSSRDSETHGRKLYYLYANFADAYYKLGTQPRPGVSDAFTTTSPVWQVVVKESFHPEPFDVKLASKPVVLKLPEFWLNGFDEPKAASDDPDDVDTVLLDGKVYHAGYPTGLFIMLKLDPKTPDTDEGWVYAVTTPAGKEVIEAGRIASCMECHKETGRDRLYGAKWTWPGYKDGKPVPPKKKD